MIFKLLRGPRNVDEMPFLDHLEELRWRILWSLVALLASTMGAFLLVTHFDLLGLLARPVEPFLDGGKLAYLGPADPFFLTVKLAVVIGILLAAPVICYQVWVFVSPALVKEEKRVIVPALYLGLVLFMAGAALAYFIVLPLALRFLMGFQVESLEPNLIAGAYLGFVVRLLLAFGFAFELPIVLVLLATLGVTSADGLASKRRFAIVGATILASLITPGDVVSTIFLMVPLLLLYELGILLIRMMERRRDRAESAAAAEAS